MVNSTRKRTRRKNTVNEEEATIEKKSARKPARRSRKNSTKAATAEETNAEEPQSADEVMDKVAEEKEEASTATMFFQSSKVIDKKKGIRFWCLRSSLQSKLNSASHYLSNDISAPKSMSELLIRIDPVEKMVSITAESMFDAGQFFIYDDFDTDAEEEFYFSIAPQNILTALDIISSDSVTLEMIENEDGETAVLWILDDNEEGQNTNFIVTIPDDENQPAVPIGVAEESISFEPDVWLSAYAEAERCRHSSDAQLSQVFSSVYVDEDEEAYIKFSATDGTHIATSRAILTERNGEQLNKINFNPDAINKAIPHIQNGASVTMMLSADNDKDEDQEEWEVEATQEEQLVVTETLDHLDRVLSRIKLATFVSTSRDVEGTIGQAIATTLERITITAKIDYVRFAQAISNANRIHGLNPENTDNTNRVYLAFNGDTVTIHSHNPNRNANATKSISEIERIDESDKNNSAYGEYRIMGISTTYSLPIIERFNPDNGEAAIAFYAGSSDDESEILRGMMVMRVDEASEWNQDDNIPHFVTGISGAALTNIEAELDEDEDDEEYDEEDYDDEEEE